MTWRNKINTHDRYSSRGEQLILEALHQNHVHPLTKTDIVLEATRPDFLFPDQKLAVYLDCEQIHLPKEELDARITGKLEEKGYRVIRIRYRPPLGRRKAIEIANRIRQELPRK